MARTRNPEQHALRRDGFVDAGQHLITTRGYAQFSVQDVLDETGASKGAFYHYFASKEALLDAVVDRMADAATAIVEPMLDDQAIPAPAKLGRLFAGIASFKAERKDLILAILRVWLSDDNALVRDKQRKLVGARLEPWLDRIVSQGIRDGDFSSRYPFHLGRVLATFITGMSELSADLWVQRQLGTITYEEVEQTFDAYGEAFERMLGARPGSITFLDPHTLRFWFG